MLFHCVSEELGGRMSDRGQEAQQTDISVRRVCLVAFRHSDHEIGNPVFHAAFWQSDREIGNPVFTTNPSF